MLLIICVKLNETRQNFLCTENFAVVYGISFEPASCFKTNHHLNPIAMKTKGNITRTILLPVLLAGCVLAVSLALAKTYKGNAEIRGTVIEAGEEHPLIGATLILLDLSGNKVMTVMSDMQGHFRFTGITPGRYHLSVTKPGYKPWVKKNLSAETANVTELVVKLNIEPGPARSETALQEQAMTIIGVQMQETKSLNSKLTVAGCREAPASAYAVSADYEIREFNAESYDKNNENDFKEVVGNPLSTFSIDVDRASYSNVRRFLNNNTLPYKDAVRIEELINYFDYDYPQPVNGDPFSVNLDLGDCPWNPAHKLVLIGIKGKEVKTDQVPPSNLVFLIDVSGSMADENKLPLLKQAFRILVNNLRPADRVAMVVYAGAAGVVLQSTPGNEKQEILSALGQLEAGGSTAGGAGINLAYQIAKQNFIPGGNNRVILATDGDFNIGASSDAEMERLIEEKRKEGVFLTVLGFGMGNYKDSKMEKLADAGNGNYAYIDNILEAKKMFGTELWGTLFTIAKDVKIQVEFNPGKVKAYRLIGYENRILNKEDFNNDRKDAGDIGSGHSVTALYEIIPSGSAESLPPVDPLEYQHSQVNGSPNLMTVKLRYKNPDDTISQLIVNRVKESDLKHNSSSANLGFASAVAEFGMLLRDSEHKGNSNWDQVIALANLSRGNDTYGYRQDFIQLAETAKLLSR